MQEGERQISPTIEGIRRDHVARYEFAARIIPKSSKVIDFAAGIGYGSKIMSDFGHLVSSYDIDDDALAYGREHYPHGGEYLKVNGNAPGEFIDADVAVCFETIEHIEDPIPLLKALRVSSPTLIASVPNEDVIPYEIAPGVVTAFHYRHYTKHEFKSLLQECGWCVTEWYGQSGQESEVEANIAGRTLIAIATRDVMTNKKSSEKHIAILGLGGSIDQYLDIAKRKGGRSKFCDEVWAINALGNVFDCDMVFHMDDIRIQEIRAAAAPASNIAALVDWIKTSKTPVITSRAHPEYPALVEFPLEDVLNDLGHDYFNSTAAYAIAFAIHIRATQISVFGMDFSYANTHDAEKGRGCVEFWLGQAHARGIKINLPKTTTLMDSCCPRSARLYGYDMVNVNFNVQEDGKLKLDFTQCKTLPTAAEIEKSYDHSAPISKQHLGTKA